MKRKRILALALGILLLEDCGKVPAPGETATETTAQPQQVFWTAQYSGSMEPVARQTNRNGAIRPAIPSAVINDRLLVQLSETMVEISYRDKDGKLVSGQTGEFRYGLFTPEQYMTNDADCLPIQGTF